MATPIDVVMFKCRKIGEIVRYLPDKKTNKMSALSQTDATARIAPKIWQGQLAPNIWLTVFQISSKSVYFRWSYSRTHEGHSFAP